MGNLQSVNNKRERYRDLTKFPLVNKENKTYRKAYKRHLPAGWNDIQIELWAAGKRLEIEDGGLGEFQHYKNALQAAYPILQDEWSHWDDIKLESMIGEPSVNTWLAGAGVGKSWFMGTFARFWYAANPKERGVMIINTTQASQDDRAWGYCLKAGLDFKFLAGSDIGTKANPKIGLKIKDKNGKLKTIPQVGIITKTVKEGSSARATQDLKGLHPKELMVIMEESNHQNRNHLKRAYGNWIENRWYKALLVGNPEIEDRDETNTDALYHFSTPKAGWPAIKWGHDLMWENIFGGSTYHFDPYDSPAISDPERYIESYWLPTEAKLEEKAARIPGGEDSALFKQQVRGIYDHESIAYTPITRGMCAKFDVRKNAHFTGFQRQRWASFDPAYSGTDEAFLKIAESGLTEDGRIVMDFIGEATNFSFVADSSLGKEPSFQMLEWVNSILTEWKVPPENFVMDAQIIGIGLGDIFATYLSSQINRIKTSGKASGTTVRGTDYKASEIYGNRITEMWMNFQKLMINQQIKGLDESIIEQLIEMPAVKVGEKIKVIEKKEFRKKFGYSPDRAEAALFLIDLALSKGMEQKGVAEVEEHQLDWQSNPWVQGRAIEDGGGVFINASGTPFGAEIEEQDGSWQGIARGIQGNWWE